MMMMMGVIRGGWGAHAAAVESSVPVAVFQRVGVSGVGAVVVGVGAVIAAAFVVFFLHGVHCYVSVISSVLGSPCITVGGEDEGD